MRRFTPGAARHPANAWPLFLVGFLLFGFLESSNAEPTEEKPTETKAEKPAEAKAEESILFHPVTEEAGIRFVHDNGASEEKYMPETMGAGGLFWDFDNDDQIDILLIDSGTVDGSRPSRTALYRNLGDGTFADVTSRSGIRGRGYGMGACAADYDNDGHTDLYLTDFGPNTLYRNLGDGTFADVTERAKVGSTLWSMGCAFGDFDNDGDLDLVVSNYVDFALDNNKYCGDHVKRIRAYCHPNVYNGQPDLLYRNNGDGTWTDITRPAGLYTAAGKGLGVVLGDYDRNGGLDIYFGNDSVPNFLYRNRRDGTFEEVGLLAGVAVNGEGHREAGMGTDFGDYDNDGLLDIFVTNLDMETNTLYRNMGGDFFIDESFTSRLAEPSLRLVGFGTTFFDYDNDGDLDVAVANGHILDNASLFRDNITYEQPNQLFRNQAAQQVFQETTATAGPGFLLEKVSRALAVGDYDNDGDLDILITNNGQSPDLLRNDGGNQSNWLRVHTVGTTSNRNGVGAMVSLTIGSQKQLRQVSAGSSYLGQNDPRVHFGLGKAKRVDRLEVHWPSGKVDVLQNLEPNQQVVVIEGKTAEAGNGEEPTEAQEKKHP